METLNAVLQSLLITVIQVLVPIALAYVIAWSKKQYELARAKIPAEQLAFIEALVKQLVVAAEQNGLTGALANEGEVKKQWVMARLQESLDKAGLKVDVYALSDLIEAQVYEAFTKAK